MVLTAILSRDGLVGTRSPKNRGRSPKAWRGTVNETSTGTAFFSKTYDEAFALLLAARNYVAFEEVSDRADLGAVDRLAMTCETTRMTARITHIMAWLLFQKAVHAGEIGRNPADRELCRLGGHRVCMGDDPHWYDTLPPRLQTLLERSRALYLRVARLDQMLARA